MTTDNCESAAKQLLFFDARADSRSNVREPVSGRIRVRLLDPEMYDSEQFYLRLTVPQALHAIKALTEAVGDVCKRADISDALHRTCVGNPTSPDFGGTKP